MILGLDTVLGSVIDDVQVGLKNISNIQINDGIFDELHVRNTIVDITEKSDYDNATVLKADFNGDLEAGNVNMRGNAIKKIRLKRKEESDSIYSTVKEYDFENQISTRTYECKDYFPRGGVSCSWMSVPVDESGIEGIGDSVDSVLNYEGWWVIDPDDPENYSVQFLYDVDSVDITTEQDRTVLTTFSQFPYVRYGKKYVNQFTLKGLVVNEGVPVWKQIKKIETMCKTHKTFLVKDANGNRYLADIYSPARTTNEAISDINNISLSVYEISEVTNTNISTSVALDPTILQFNVGDDGNLYVTKNDNVSGIDFDINEGDLILTIN